MPLVTLIRPPSVVSRYALTLNATPPLSLAYVAASLTRAGYEVQVIDAVGEGLDTMGPGYRDHVVLHGLTQEQIVARVDPRAEVVGVSCMFSNEWPVVRSLLAALHAQAPDRPLVCGGEHPSAVPEFCLRDVPGLTACVLGEGEETAVELFDALSKRESIESIAGVAYLHEGRF